MASRFTLSKFATRILYLYLLDFSSCQGQPAASQLAALMDMKIAWNANHVLDTWVTAIPCSGWFTLTCDANNMVTQLNMFNQTLSGGIPSSIGNLTKLTFLNFGVTGLSGSIPDSLGALTNLNYMNLGTNNFSGSIPPKLGSLVALQSLYMDRNSFTGSIPDSLTALSNLINFALHDNNLIGSIPSLGSFGMLQNLALDHNRLTGPIPPSISALMNLTTLSLSVNNLTGSIPSSLGTLSLQYLDVSDNFLSGTPGDLPFQLKGLHLDLDFNCFSQYYQQKSFDVCAAFCGCNSFPVGAPVAAAPSLAPIGSTPSASPSSSNNTTTFIAVGVALGVVAIVFTIVMCLCCCRKEMYRKVTLEAPMAREEIQSKKEINIEISRVPRLGSFIPLEIILSGTHNFDEASVVGEGGFGKVYKAITLEGALWAIKRSKYVARGVKMEFEVEVEVVSRMHHTNLASLIGYCDEGGEEILVYEFVPCGSLEESLHPKSGSSHEDVRMSFEERLKIARGAAEGLRYLHTFADPPIVHRDIKPANLLLGKDFVVKVADFGLLKHHDGMGMAMTTKVQGTYGYIDPDYYKSNRVTTKSDVYSFGVVLLELMTGRKAVLPNPREKGEYIHITTWVKPNLLSRDFNSLVDPRMVGGASPTELLQYFSIASQCVQPNSNDRPEMQEVAVRLASIGMAEGVVASQDGESTRLGVSTPYVDEIGSAYRMSGNIFNYSTSNEDDRVLAPSADFGGAR